MEKNAAHFSKYSKSSETSGGNEGTAKNSSIEIPSISLPKGGGAIKSIDDKFSVNAANGTAGFSVPFPFSPSRNAFMPSMALSYNSGGGNSTFGLGWNAEPAFIARKSDKKLPQYNDAEDSDTFLFSGAEDLVPELIETTPGNWMKDPYLPDNVKRYRPRTEGGFARIEKIIEADGNVYWKVTSKDNVVSVFGKSRLARIANPENDLKIFKWMLEFSYDDKGNCFQYEYKSEDKEKVPNNLHEKNRRNDFSKCSNTYLKRIKYCNKTHLHKNTILFDDWDNSLLPIEYFLELVLDYGEHNTDNPTPTDDLGWPCREDPFSEYRSGFEIRTYRLCNRLLMFHHFPPALGEQPCLVRSTKLNYKNGTAFTFLESVTQTGYVRTDETYKSRSLPPIEFNYEPLGWNTKVETLAKESVENLPIGIDDQLYQWIDLYSEGISGILTEQANAWYYKKNLGGGNFESLKLVTPKPSLTGLSTGAVHFQDLEGNGQKSLVSNELNGYYDLTEEDEWIPFKTFNEVPNIDLRDPNLKFLDLDGDGKADMLFSQDDIFVWYASKGKKGYDDHRQVRKARDEEKGPDIVFADSTQSIVLTDMSGDGMTDIVRIKNGSVEYWPNLGYGKFGAKVTMSNSPWFDQPDNYNSRYIKLADLDGSGTTDIVYLGKDSFKIYFNQSGNSWSEENLVPGANPLPFPKIDDHVNVNIIDLLGNGTGCIVWSSPLPKYAANPLRYIDLMGGKKPHVMISYNNNLGKEVKMEYASSTKFYLDDKLAGTPWITKLPFPVQVVTKVTTTDKWRKTTFTNQYTYHHGYYDFGEREFRGFGRVDQADVETFDKFLAGNIASPYISDDYTLYQPPVLTKTWFHTGAFINKQKILSQFREEYFIPASDIFQENNLPEPDLEAQQLTVEEWKEALRTCKGMTLRQEVFELDVDQLSVAKIVPVKLFSTAYSNCHIKLLQPKKVNPHAVFLTTGSETVTYNYELDLRLEGVIIDPRIAHSLNLKSDEYGNVLEAVSVVYPRIGSHADSSLPDGAELLIEEVQKKQHIAYSVNLFTNDIITIADYRLPLPCEAKTFELTGLFPAGELYFSLEEIRNAAPLDIPEIEYHQIANPDSTQKRLVQHVRILYFHDLQTPEPFGILNALALPYETYTLALTEELLAATIGEKLNLLKLTGEDDDAMLDRILTVGGYHKLDNKWWIRSGIAGFAPDAADHFYLPEKYTDPFGHVTWVNYDVDDLYIESSDDAVGNHTEVLQFEYQVLAPSAMKDINDNILEIKFDIIGMPAAMAIKGKGDEGDNLDGVETDISQEQLLTFFTTAYTETDAQAFLGNATARYIYYLGEVMADTTITYGTHPACAAGITREKHIAQIGADETSPVQVAFEYSDGMGTVLCAKVQAEAETEGGAARWITNGKTILNNKGKPVKQYEPYFTENHFYQEPVEKGVTAVIYYDAAGRVVRTEAPDKSYSRVEFTPWFSKAYDQNDTVLEEGNGWYRNNTNSTDTTIPMATNAQKNAAALAAIHADTPTQIFTDSLGRDVISITHNKWQRVDDFGTVTLYDKKYLTYTKLDAEGKPLWIRDARGNRVMQYIFPYKPDGTAELAWSESYAPCYDIAGNLLFQHSMDAGDRWMITDAAGKPFYSWDVNERQLEDNSLLSEQRMYHAEYDKLHRPIKLWLTINDAPRALIDRTIYGDDKTIPVELVPDSQAVNLRGQAYQHYDSGGVITNNHFDFNGNLLEAQKQIARAFKAPLIDWQDGSENNTLEPEIVFTQQTEYDALNRMTRHYNWHKSNINVAMYEPKYNKRSLLEAEDIVVKSNIVEGVYSGGQRTTAINRIVYDAKGQIERIWYANNTVTRYKYHPETFRLMQLRTTRRDAVTQVDYDPPFPEHNSGLRDNNVLQQLNYTYDPIGNITEIYDNAYEPIFFNNQIIEPRSTYTYDALYQLIEASGRENSALNNAPEGKEAETIPANFPINGQNVLRSYVQEYEYDATGNINRMIHRAGIGNLSEGWTRIYEYNENSNRLAKTWTNNDETNAVEYDYDTHGSIRNHENVGEEAYMRWNYNDILQSLNFIGGGWAYYQYNSSKERNRKVIERLEGIKEERHYLGGMEWYRRKNATGDVVEEIETHHLFAGSQRVLIIEDVVSTENANLTIGVLYRYQYSNHLGSASLELNEDAAIISYEEYHPYGTSSYHATNTGIKAVDKRYRYTGMERDEESGLAYHSARYYLPWLGRWLSADPIGVAEGMNNYEYANNSPVNFIDENGKRPYRHIMKLQLHSDEFLNDQLATLTGFRNYILEHGANRHLISEFLEKNEKKYSFSRLLKQHGFELNWWAGGKNVTHFINAVNNYEQGFVGGSQYDLSLAEAYGYIDTSGEVNVADSSGGFRGTKLQFMTHQRNKKIEYTAAVQQNANSGILGAAGAAYGGEHALELSSIGAAAGDIGLASASIATAYLTSKQAKSSSKVPPLVPTSKTRPQSLLQRAKAAGVEQEIEGPIQVFAHGTTSEMAKALIETQGGILSSTGGRFGGRFFAVPDIDVAKTFAARAATQIAGANPSIVGIALPSSTVAQLKANNLLQIRPIDSPPSGVSTGAQEWVFQPGAIDSLKKDGFFYGM